MRVHLVIGLVLCAQSCVCGAPPLGFADTFGPKGADGDALHTYAANAAVRIDVASPDGSVDVTALHAEVDGSLSFDEDETGDLPDLHLRTGDAGEGTLRVLDADGNELASRTLTIVAPDEMTLAVTAPARPGITLPAVDIAGVRIFASGKAAFRTTLRAGGAEVFGLDAVTATPSDASVGTRNGIGADGDVGEFQRNAVEVSVPDGVAAFDVALAAGTATVTLHVVPTRLNEISDFVLEDQATAGAAEGDTLAVVAHSLAGTEPVFGVPVQWTYDGAVLTQEDDDQAPLIGDVLQFIRQADNDVDIVAAFAGLRAEGRVQGAADGSSVTSITGACGAGGAPLVVALAALLGMRRRRGR